MIILIIILGLTNVALYYLGVFQMLGLDKSSSHMETN